jgi:hypothetical protein
MAAATTDQIIIERLRSFPFQWLRSSALVDYLLLSASVKPAARLQVDSASGLDYLMAWCQKSALDFAADVDGFACVSVEPGFASKILEIDRRTDPHEIELGVALGYPRCCCERIARVGESSIDSYAREVAQWEFTGPYRRINPAHYSSGLALISHLPCAINCGPSLAIADRALEFVVAHASEPILRSLSRSQLVTDDNR